MASQPTLIIRKSQMDAMSAATGQPTVVPCEYTWVEFELLDEDGKPVPNIPFRVKLPDGTIVNSTLNAQGRARFPTVVPGNCEFSFPEIHSKEWQQTQ